MTFTFKQLLIGLVVGHAVVTGVKALVAVERGGVTVDRPLLRFGDGQFQLRNACDNGPATVDCDGHPVDEEWLLRPITPRSLGGEPELAEPFV